MATRAGSAPPGRGREGHSFSPPVRPDPTQTTQPKGVPPLTPRKKEGSWSKKVRPKVVKRSLRRDAWAQRGSIAMSRTETILVSSSGDVCVCRCRRSSTPYLDIVRTNALAAWANLIPCCDADCISIGQVEGSWSPVFQVDDRARSQPSDVSTYEWEEKEEDRGRIKGLLGGALHAQEATDQDAWDQGATEQHSQLENDDRDARPHDMRSNDVVYDGGILPLPSFDYSHFKAGHNDMVPHRDPKQHIGSPSARKKKRSHLPHIPEGMPREEKKADEDVVRPHAEVPRFVHGVPMFLSTLAQIRITKVSAHPLGAHVLLISAEALLFTYGLNNHGQLGIGIKSHVKDDTRGFITTPTIITPLLENGGKAINCAAGMDHSLVVVSTEGRRVQNVKNRSSAMSHSDHAAFAINRVTSSPSRLNIDTDEDEDCSENTTVSDFTNDDSVQHHQLYGFGSNEFMKIGLVSVASPDGAVQGIVKDVLLPRRVALHCTVWPQKSGSNGKPSIPQGIFELKASIEHSAAIVRRATGDVETYFWGNANLGALGIPLESEKSSSEAEDSVPIPRSPRQNLFPHPTVVESLSCRPNQDSILGFPVEIALGPYCSFVVMSTGRCMSFGFSAEGMLGLGFGVTHSMVPKELFLPKKGDIPTGIVSISAGAHHTIALGDDGVAYSWGINSNDRLGLGHDDDFVKVGNSPGDLGDAVAVVEWAPQPIELSGGPLTDANRVAHVCAGYDSSLLVVRSGQVLSFGKRSGRLGLGEVEVDVSTPHPLFGGFRLFYADFATRRNLASHCRRATSVGAAH